MKAYNLQLCLLCETGAAGSVCAETLREEGYKGRIVLICKEPALPYDRIKVGKVMDMAVDKLYLRSDAFYKVSPYLLQLLDILFEYVSYLKYFNYQIV